MLSIPDSMIPGPTRAILRGIGQIFFQENAITGGVFVLGILWNSPIMAIGAVVGSLIGWGTAVLAKFDESEISAGIFGFNSSLVGIATLFFFRPSVGSIALLIVGCIAAAFVTRLMRRYVPFPTYTTPFIVTTWAVFFLGMALGVARVEPAVVDGTKEVAASSSAFVPSIEAVFHGIGQVKFQGSVLTGLLFLVGIALSDWRHAAWVLLASVIATSMAYLAHCPTADIVLGLYGYNATLAAIALFLWRRSVIPPLLGILLSVPLTEYFPMLGLPTLTAPFVLATWLVLAFGWIEGKFFASEKPSTS
jgi:urea transporter